MFKPQAVPTGVFIKQEQDRVFKSHRRYGPKFSREDCLHSSGQNTLLDVIYDLQGWP